MFGTILAYGFIGIMLLVLLAVAVEGVLQMIDKDRRRQEAKNAKR
jgi:hypothetical protein